MAAEAAHREVLQKIVEDTLKEIFVARLHDTSTGMRNSSSQFVQHMLMHIIESGTLDTVLEQIFEKSSRSDTFGKATAS